MIADTAHSTTADSRRREIAAAARALVAERGFEGLRTRDIAERVGINIATLHYHVPSKEALIELLASSMREDFIAQDIARPRAGLPALDQFRLELSDYRASLASDFELLLAFAELQGRSRRDPKVRAAIGPMETHWRAKFERMLAQGRHEGRFRADIDPAAAAIMVVGALSAFPRFHGSDLAAFDRLAAELERAVANPGQGQGTEETHHSRKEQR